MDLLALEARNSGRGVAACDCAALGLMPLPLLLSLPDLESVVMLPEPFVFFALLVLALNAVSFTALALWSTTAWGGLILRSGALVERVNALPEAGGLLLVTTQLPRMLRSGWTFW